MTTARALLNAAARDPMQAAGWTPRAAGWFTRALFPDALAVLAIGTATKHSTPGEGQATAHLGLRLNRVEETASALCAIKDGGYQQRTVVVGLGYATPAARWLEWPVSAGTAAAVADDLAATASEHGLPYLERLAADHDRLAAELRDDSALDLARKVVVLAFVGRTDEARTVLEHSLGRLNGRTDAAAMQQREAGARLSQWLARDHE